MLNGFLLVEHNADGGLKIRTDGSIPTTDTDSALAANSDSKVASQKATKTYVDTATATTEAKLNRYGTLANLPASGQHTGQTYYATDSTERYVWDGTSWTLPSKPKLVHNWDIMGGNGLTPAWISPPTGGTTQHATIQSHLHRGQFQSATATDNESIRQVFLKTGTNWYNSEMHSIWYGNSPFLELQILSMGGSPTGGTFTITYSGQTTSPLAYNAPPATVQSALEALSNIGVGQVQCGYSGTNGNLPAGNYSIHLVGTLADKYNPLMTTTSSLTGSSPTVKITSPYSIQQGHMHRAYDTGGGNYTSIMVDNNVIFQLYSSLNLQAWGFPPLAQGSPAGNVTSPTPRWQVLSYQRFSFGGFYIGEYRVRDVSGLRPGMTIAAKNCTDTTFNVNNIIVSGVDTSRNVVQIIDTTAGHNNAVAWKSEPSASAYVVGDISTWIDNPLGYFPYHVRSAVYDDQLFVKLWRVNEPEPDKGITSAIQAVQDFSGETVVTPITSGNPGYCGLIVNHLYGGGYMEYGDVEFTRL